VGLTFFSTFGLRCTSLLTTNTGRVDGILQIFGSNDGFNRMGGKFMSTVRVLVGTRKGAFILTSDGKRKDWKVNGPHFAGWEMYHLKGSSADPNRIYASQTSGWFGQIIQRSDDGGKTWFQPGTPPGETTGPGGTPTLRRDLSRAVAKCGKMAGSQWVERRRPVARGRRGTGAPLRRLICYRIILHIEISVIYWRR